MAETAQPKPMDAHTHDEATRRDFITIAASAITGIGAAIAAWPLIDSMNPARDTLAAGAPVDIDVSHIQPGQQIVILWRSRPVFIMHRADAELKKLQDASENSQLSDADSAVRQQPDYAQNWHRSIKPELLVLVGICTHLGCIPGFMPEPGNTPVEGWQGGYFCPCHGSRYDLAGRVFRGVPAPYNLPVPPYRFLSDTMIRIGENPEGSTFEFNSIQQI